MTPEATYSALHLVGAWRVMLAHLAGEKPPPMPDAPGRRHRGPSDPPTDPLADAWAAKHAPEANP